MKMQEMTVGSDSDCFEVCGKSVMQCVCPRCGAHHKLKLHWSGRGTPRKFCSTCKKDSLNWHLGNCYDLHVAIRNVT